MQGWKFKTPLLGEIKQSHSMEGILRAGDKAMYNNIMDQSRNPGASLDLNPSTTIDLVCYIEQVI